MSATADRSPVALSDSTTQVLARADGLELLGEVEDSGYERGISLVRRGDGQMVQLGPLQYALLEAVDGERDCSKLSTAMCDRLGRECDEAAVAAIAQKLAEQGLLAGFEDKAPKRSNPLLALRWKVVVSDPTLTRRLTAPFMGLFRLAIVLPVLAAFVAACWFVLVEKGMASGAAQAFGKPELILLLFGLGIAAAAFHEIGHAAACRYGGGKPGAMGMGIYLVWPAFYTDVTDSYRLPRRARLRTDLGGLYFNAVVAVVTLATWFFLRVDALLLLIALQLVEMVKQLSPVIRADGYHILSDVTGVPDLYAHIGPTLKRLLPGHPQEPSALTGRARIIVTLWVLVIVPVLLAIMLGVVMLLPRLIASTLESGGSVLSAMAAQATGLQVPELLVSLLRLVGLALPVLGATYISWRLASAATRGAARWSRGHLERRLFAALLAIGVVGLLVLAWWPSGQYEPIRASDKGTLASFMTSEPAARARVTETTQASVPTGTYLGITMVPEGGATDENPAILVLEPGDGSEPIAIVSDTDASTSAAQFEFDMPDAPGNDDSQAVALNRTDGGVTYTIAYSLVTVRDGDDVDQRNSAHAYANCNACTTVAVSFQVVLIVGTSPLIAPVNFAEALNGNCLECVTTAIANQIVVSVGEEPSAELLTRLREELERLDALDDLGADASPADLLTQVTNVQQTINQLLADSGLTPEAQEGAGADSTAPSGSETEQPTGDSTASPDATPDSSTGDPATDAGAEPEPDPTSGEPPTPTTDGSG